jgi:hypothetical protein
MRDIMKRERRNASRKPHNERISRQKKTRRTRS